MNKYEELLKLDMENFFAVQAFAKVFEFGLFANIFFLQAGIV